MVWREEWCRGKEGLRVRLDGRRMVAGHVRRMALSLLLGGGSTVM